MDWEEAMKARANNILLGILRKGMLVLMMVLFAVTHTRFLTI
jgi:hypothetical protein